MFDIKEIKNPLLVDIKCRQQEITEKDKVFMAYKMNYKKDLEMVGIYAGDTINELTSDNYLNAVKEQFAKENASVVGMTSAMAGVSLDDLLSYKLILIPISEGSLFIDYKVTLTQDKPDV